MGSFSMQCTYSGLPITAGNPVRVILLTENPYSEKANFCYSHDAWVPRTFPIQAEYNDYGSIEEVKEGILKDLLLQGFQYDMLERGVGDNTYHDLATKKDMDFDAFLDALRAGRILVSEHGAVAVTEASSKSSTLKKFAKSLLRPIQDIENEIKETTAKITGIPVVKENPVQPTPTMKSVEHLFREAGLPLSGPKHFIVSDEEGLYGSVRVRYSDYSDKLKNIEEAMKVVAPHYAAMVTVGSGHYADDAELLIRGKVGVKDDRGLPGFTHKHRERKSNLQVAVAMIREDVWQALVEAHGAPAVKRIYGWADPRPYVEKAWAEVAKTAREEEENFFRMSGREWFGVDSYDKKLSTGNIVGNVLGLGSHWRLMAAKKETMTAEEQKEFIDVVIEQIKVMFMMDMTRYWWRPSHSNGPQSGEWSAHAVINRAVAAISATKFKEIEQERIADDKAHAEYLKKNGYNHAMAKANRCAKALEILQAPEYKDKKIWLHDYNSNLLDDRPDLKRNGLHHGYPMSVVSEITPTKPDYSDSIGGAGLATFATEANTAAGHAFVTNSRYKLVPYSEVKIRIEMGIKQDIEAFKKEASKYPKPKAKKG